MSKKKIISIVSVLAIILVATSIISYSIATSGSGSKKSKEISTEMTNRGLNIDTEYTTNIDLIIENANKTADSDKYKIVEIIPSSAAASDLATYVNDGKFKSYVIDANSEKGAVMADDMIVIDTIKVSQGVNLDSEMTSNIIGGIATLRTILNEADLIYLSSPGYMNSSGNAVLGYNAYDGTDNMSEDVYNFLHTYSFLY